MGRPVIGTAIILEKWTEGRRGRRYKISYEFQADGSKFRVLGREIDISLWERSLKGDSVDVTFLKGRPRTCRLTEQAEFETSSARLGCLAALMCCIVAAALTMGVSFRSPSASAEEATSARNLNLLAFTLSFSLLLICMCACMASRGDGDLYGGQVIVDENDGSNSESSDF